MTAPFAVTIPAWMADAHCAKVDPADRDAWFPRGAGNGHGKEAREVCRRCPVVAECLEYALGMEVNPDGIWGATSWGERQQMRRGRVA